MKIITARIHRELGWLFTEVMTNMEAGSEMLENSVTGNATASTAAAAFNRTADPSASVSNPLYSNVTAR